MEKICSTCGKLKPIDQYHRDVSKKDGHRNNCKQCTIFNKNYKKDLESIKEKMCNTCKRVKPIDSFIEDNRTPLGYGMKCLSCASEKLCRGCQLKKHVSEFPTNGRSSDGYRSKCKLCENEITRRRYKNEATRSRILAQNAGYRFKKGSREGSRERMLLKLYNMTLEQYETILNSQDRKCKICKCLEGERGRSYLAVDHDHKTGKVRGLLCDPCNRGLGMFKDDPEILKNAIIYLSMMAAHFG